MGWNAKMVLRTPGKPERNSFVESDFDGLRVHMKQCAAAQGRFPRVRSLFDSVTSFAGSRIVSCGAIAFVVIVAVVLAS